VPRAGDEGRAVEAVWIAFYGDNWLWDWVPRLGPLALEGSIAGPTRGQGFLLPMPEWDAIKVLRAETSAVGVKRGRP
jgi:hypothetical protein